MGGCGRRGWSVGLGLLLGVVSANAEEGKPADRARLPALLKAGADAAKAKKWDDCIQALSAAAAIERADRTWGELGLCENEAAHFTDAHSHLREALASATPGMLAKEPWKRYQQGLGFAYDRVALVMFTASPPDVLIVVDGKPIGRADGRSYAVTPGTHTFVGKLPGYEDVIHKRTLAARDVPNIHFQMTPKPAVLPSALPKATIAPSVTPPFVPVSSPQAPAPPWYEPTGSPRGVMLVLTSGMLLATLTAAGVAIGMEIRRADLGSGLSPTACNSANAPVPAKCGPILEAHNQRNSAEGLAIGTGIATGVLAGLLVGLVIREDKAIPHATATVTASDKGGGLAISGAW